jgi:hypothetical protein
MAFNSKAKRLDGPVMDKMIKRPVVENKRIARLELRKALEANKCQ